MSHAKPKTRTEANSPEATRHLSEKQKRALDTQADAEHLDGKKREQLTRKVASKK